VELRVDHLTLQIENGVTALVATDEAARFRLRRDLVRAVHRRLDVLLLDERTSSVEAVEGPPVVLVCAERMTGAGSLAGRVVLLEHGRVRFDGSLATFCTRLDGSRDDPGSALLRWRFAADLLPR